MPKLYIDSVEEFRKRVETADFEICTFIYSAVKRGASRGYSKVKVFDMVVKHDPATEYSFSLERPQWKKALESCIRVYSEQELYEDCIEIKRLLESLD